MKILLVNKFHYHRGGSETYYLNLAKALESRGHEVAFFSMQDEKNYANPWSHYFVSPKDYNAKTGLGKKIRNGLSLMYSFETKKNFEALLQDFRPDIIHLNLVHRQLTFSLLDAPSARTIPVIYTAHDYLLVCPSHTMLDGRGEICERCLGGRFLHCITHSCVKASRAKSILATVEAYYLKWRKTYSRIDAFVAPSRFMGNKLVAGGLPEEKILVLQNFMESTRQEPATLVTVADRFTHPYVLFFGRLTKEKGIDTLIRAFLRSEVSCRLVIAGDGPQKKELTELAASNSQGKSILFTGHLLSDELRRLVEHATYSVASSLWRENMPLAIIESFSAGTPVLGSSIGGIPELIEEERTGFLFKPGNVDDLTQALDRAMSVEKDAYIKMQTACRVYVEEHCNEKAYLDMLTSLYRHLLKERTRG